MSHAQSPRPAIPMQPREKLLATVLAAVVAFFVLRPLLDSLFVEPLRQRDARVRSLKLELQALEDQQFGLLRAQRALAGYRAESLPPDPLNAQREYLEWLTDLAQLCGWRNPQFTLGSASARHASYTPIQVTIRGAATLDQVNALLRHMQATALVQRVANLQLDSTGFDGNPQLNVTLTAEGVAVAGIPARTRLFPTASLAQELKPGDELLSVADAAGFPSETPFFARVDSEFVEVRAVDGPKWTVVRGALGSQPAAHTADSPVELAPLRVSGEGLGRADSLPSVTRLFAKQPPPGQTQLAADLSPAVRGRTWTAELRLQNWDPEHGPPEFRLKSGAPGGLSIDGHSGRLQWTPAEDTPLGPHEVNVAVYGRDPNTAIVERRLSLEVRRPNNPPRLNLPQVVDVWLGRPWNFTVPVDDPDLPEDRLTFAVAGSVPQGLTIDRATGRLTWMPPADMSLGEITLQVTVTDTGVPPATATQPLTLRLVDDSGLYTYFVGSVGQGGSREAWLYDRSTNRRTVLRKGDTFQIADIAGTVLQITEDSLDVRSGEGVYRLDIGKNLRNWRAIQNRGGAVTTDEETASEEEGGP